MRDFKGMKRQRSRNRNGGGGGGGGGGKPQHNANRAFDSNGPEGVKVRGAAQGVYEKYQQLARDAHTAGDRVLAENYLQHAEHYFRLMRAMQPQRPLSEIIGRDQFVSGYDIDFEDDGGQSDTADGDAETETGEGADHSGDRSPRQEVRQGDHRQNDYRQNDYRQNDYRQNDYRQSEGRTQAEQPRTDRYQPDRGNSERASGDAAQADRPAREDRGGGRPPREDRPRFNRDDRPPRAERPERVDRQERAERPDRDPLGVIEPQATPLTSPSPTSPSLASKSPIPTPVLSTPLISTPLPLAPIAAVSPAAGAAPLLRADDGEVSHAPAFLQARPEAAEEPRRPRRRRAPATFAGDPPGTAPVTDEG